MFGKLIKYEFKTLGKWYLGLYAIVGILSVAMGFWIQSFILRSMSETNSYSYGYDYGSSVEGVLFGFAIMVLVLVSAGLLISTFLMIALRFKNNTYGRQGYLTMTLPVTSHQILLSKLLSGIILYFFAGLAIFLAMGLIATIALFPVRHEIPFHELPMLLNEFITSSFWYEYNGWLMVLTYALEVPVTILCVYFAISLGQLFKDHRTVLAVVFYFAINFGISFISILFMIPSLGTAAMLESSSVLYGTSILTSFVTQVILGVVFYFGSHYIMTKKLNLQ